MPEFHWRDFADLNAQELYSMLALRQKILVVEQHSPYSDLDFVDQAAWHLLTRAGSELIAYARCHLPSANSAFSSFGRVVVSERYRGKGLGNELVQRILSRLEGHPFDIAIAAQSHLEQFYSRFGFVREGEPYDDVGVPHLRMRLRSRQSPR